MSTKKMYVELVTFLENNSDKKVKSILDEVRQMCESKNTGGSEIGTTFLKDTNGHTIAIFCYYFKKWVPLSHVEVGTKINTASGYNTMCKEGVSNWTKQQRVAKNEGEELLAKLSDGSLLVEDLGTARQEIESRRKAIVEPKDATYFFTSADEVLNFIAQSEQDAVVTHE